MFRNKSARTSHFSLIPRADVPRSQFKIQHTHKTTMDASMLVPIYVDEVLPGDHFKVRATLFGRLSTPIFPVMDNLRIDTFFFFVPHRLVWDNWAKMLGEQDNPGDSTDFVVPHIVSKAGGYDTGSIFDYMGLPTAGQVGPGNTYKHSALPLRSYRLIYDQWFRDQNLQQGTKPSTGDGPDLYTDYSLFRRGKRHDYFTSCLPWPQKSDSPVGVPLGGVAPITYQPGTASGAGMSTNQIGAANTQVVDWLHSGAPGTGISPSALKTNPVTLFADLSQATAATINQLRQAFQIQKLLERDARGGTRLRELIYSHFGVDNGDARLQRPEYLGGGSSPITINPIAQTSGTPAPSGYTSTPMGTLAAMGTTLARGHGFSQAFTEHGTIIGLACVTADLTYQQGLRKMWSRETKFDFYWPAFSHLGEQAVLQKEIYCTGDPVEDEKVFGYQERWSELRYNPSLITGLFKSTSAQPIDAWHVAQKFTTAPVLDSTFISENVPLERILAVGSAAVGQQLLLDSFFDARVTRALPAYSVPGLIDHF